MASVKNSWFYRSLSRKFSFLELLLITGPTLIGWLIGVLRYPRQDIRFRLGFQGGLIFFVYICCLTLNFLIAFWDVSFFYKELSNYIHSYLVSTYLGITLYLMLASLVGLPCLFPFVGPRIDRFLR